MIAREKLLPTRNTKKKCIILIVLILGIYLLENSSITKYVNSSTFNFIIMPILWIGLIYIVWKFPHIRPKGKLKQRSFLNFWALNFATIYIIISILAGIMDALGKSPYNHSLKGIITNIIFVGSALAGREFIRSYLVNSYTKEENYLVFVLISILMTLTSISLKRYIGIKGSQDLVKLIAQYIAPEFAQNLFACYLVFLGGPLTSVIYLGIIQGFHWLSPILPDLKWITTAFIGVLCPMFFMISLQTIYLDALKKIKIRDKDEDSPISWMITSIISIGIIWFAVGVFPIYPSVIATGSMEPDIRPGDVILVKKIVDMEGVNNLKIDDVIQFRRDSILISHRIIGIRNDEKEGIGFRTKGDNNSSPDTEIVKPEDVKGIIVATVPKIGWPTLLIKSDKDIDLNEIVY